MRKKLFLTIGTISYLVSFILIIYYLIIEFSIIDIYHPLYRLFIVIITMLIMYIGGLTLKKSDIEVFNKIYKLNMYVWFIIYIIMLLNLTMFDKYFNRQITLNNEFSAYFNLNFNIVPFKTINNYILAFKNHNLTSIDFIYNIFGNLIAFTPMSFFLPRIVKKTDKWSKYFITISIMIIAVEIIQMLIKCGSCDIDDYILNVIGAMLFYIIFNNKSWKNKINHFFLLKENQKND